MAKPRLRRLLPLLCALAASQPTLAQAVDPASPTCPAAPGWSTSPQMRFRVEERPGERPVLIAEGAIDADVVPRLRAAIADFQGSEIWLRSPGGDAQAGNQAGLLIRESGMTTRIPAGWACAGACAFMFMGGMIRNVEPGGVYMLQMFTFTGDRETIQRETARGDQATADLLTDIARRSARFASGDVDYLLRMGVARALLTDIVYRQRAVQTSAGGPTWYCLNEAELRRYNVANAAQRVRPPGSLAAPPPPPGRK